MFHTKNSKDVRRKNLIQPKNNLHLAFISLHKPNELSYTNISLYRISSKKCEIEVSTFEIFVGPKKGRLYRHSSNLLGTGVLGHCLRAFTDCVLRQFARQQEPHRRLYLPGGNS